MNLITHNKEYSIATVVQATGLPLYYDGEALASNLPS